MTDAKIFQCMMGDTLIISPNWGIHPEPIFRVILWDDRHVRRPDTLYWSHTGTPAPIRMLFKDLGIPHVASEIVSKASACRMVLTEKVIHPVNGKKYALSLLAKNGLSYDNSTKRVVSEKGYIQTEIFSMFIEIFK